MSEVAQEMVEVMRGCLKQQLDYHTNDKARECELPQEFADGFRAGLQQGEEMAEAVLKSFDEELKALEEKAAAFDEDTERL